MTKQKTPNPVITVRVTKATHTRLHKQAKTNARSLSAHAALILEQHTHPKK